MSSYLKISGAAKGDQMIARASVVCGTAQAAPIVLLSRAHLAKVSSLRGSSGEAGGGSEWERGVEASDRGSGTTGRSCQGEIII